MESSADGFLPSAAACPRLRSLALTGLSLRAHQYMTSTLLSEHMCLHFSAANSTGPFRPLSSRTGVTVIRIAGGSGQKIVPIILTLNASGHSEFGLSHVAVQDISCVSRSIVSPTLATSSGGMSLVKRAHCCGHRRSHSRFPHPPNKDPSSLGIPYYGYLTVTPKSGGGRGRRGQQSHGVGQMEVVSDQINAASCAILPKRLQSCLSYCHRVFVRRCAHV
jgi:hypothetical protein